MKRHHDFVIRNAGSCATLINTDLGSDSMGPLSLEQSDVPTKKPIKSEKHINGSGTGRHSTHEGSGTDSGSGNRTNKAIKRSGYTCRKCKTHGHRIAVKKHKSECPYKNCACKRCQLVEEGRKVVAKQIALYREQTNKVHHSDGTSSSVRSSCKKKEPTPYTSPSSLMSSKPRRSTAIALNPHQSILSHAASQLSGNIPATSSTLLNPNLEFPHVSRFAFSTGEESNILHFQSSHLHQQATLNHLHQNSDQLHHPDSTSSVTLPHELSDKNAGGEKNISSLRTDDPEADYSNGLQQPMCRRCRNHNLTIPWKGHKKTCQYRNCDCSKGCALITMRKNTEKDLRNMTVHEEENSNAMRNMQHLLGSAAAATAQSRLVAASSAAAAAAAAAGMGYGADPCNSAYHKLHHAPSNLLSNASNHMYHHHHSSNQHHLGSSPLNDPNLVGSHYYSYPSMLPSSMDAAAMAASRQYAAVASLENILKVPGMYGSANSAIPGVGMGSSEMMGSLGLHSGAAAVAAAAAAAEYSAATGSIIGCSIGLPSSNSITPSCIPTSLNSLMSQETEFNPASYLFSNSGLSDNLMSSSNPSSTLENFSGNSLLSGTNQPRSELQTSRSSSTVERNSEKEFRLGNNLPSIGSGVERITPLSTDNTFSYFGSRIPPHTDFVGLVNSGGFSAFSGFPYAANLCSSGTNFLSQGDLSSSLVEDRNRSTIGLGTSSMGNNSISRSLNPPCVSGSNSGVDSSLLMMRNYAPGATAPVMSWSPLYTSMTPGSLNPSHMMQTPATVDVLAVARFPVAALQANTNEDPLQQHLMANVNIKREADVVRADYRSLINSHCY